MRKMDRKSRVLFKAILMSFLIPLIQFNPLIAEDLFIPNGQKIAPVVQRTHKLLGCIRVDNPKIYAYL